MSAHANLDQQLLRIEQQLNAVQSGLLDGSGPAFQEASRQLQCLAVELGKIKSIIPVKHWTSGQALKVRALAQQFPTLLESLARRAALVDRALSIVVPNGEFSTYATRGPYGSAVRQSGALKGFAA